MRRQLTIVIVAFLLSFSCCGARAQTPSANDTCKDVPLSLKQGPKVVANHTYALIIGNDRYTGVWPALKKAVSDAKAIDDALKIPSTNKTVLFDATSKQTRSAIRALFDNAKRDTVAQLFLWFAGHGHTISGEGFIVPVDAPNPEGVVTFRSRAISMKEFIPLLNDAPCRTRVLLIFDSCFSGTIFTNTIDHALLAKRPVANLNDPIRLFISSGHANETVADDGLFQREFVRGLQGWADINADGLVSAIEVGAYFQHVGQNTMRQKPQFGEYVRPSDPRTIGDFVFLLSHVDQK
jgi:hypothetical protein